MWEGSWRAGVASLATLPHPVTAMWAWGGGTARGAVTAALKFPVGVVEAVHHTHACPYTQHIHTSHTHAHTRKSQTELERSLSLTIHYLGELAKVTSSL